MAKVRSLMSFLRGQLSDWLHSPRTLLSGLIILALTYMYARRYQLRLEEAGLYAYFGESVFYFLSNGFGNFALTSALFLIMVSEIPRRIPFQNLMLIRGKRSTWYLSQVLFCLMITVMMVVSMLVISMLFSLPNLSGGSGWSDLDRAAAGFEGEYTLMPAFVLELPVLQATLMAGAVLTCFWFVMVFAIFLFTIFGQPNLGLLFYATLLSLKVTILWEDLTEFHLFMPTDYATIIGIASIENNDDAAHTTWMALLVYAVVICACIAIGYFRSKWMDLHFSEAK